MTADIAICVPTAPDCRGKPAALQGGLGTQGESDVDREEDRGGEGAITGMMHVCVCVFLQKLKAGGKARGRNCLSVARGRHTQCIIPVIGPLPCRTDPPSLSGPPVCLGPLHEHRWSSLIGGPG